MYMYIYMCVYIYTAYAACQTQCCKISVNPVLWTIKIALKAVNHPPLSRYSTIYIYIHILQRHHVTMLWSMIQGSRNSPPIWFLPVPKPTFRFSLAISICFLYVYQSRLSHLSYINSFLILYLIGYFSVLSHLFLCDVCHQSHVLFSINPIFCHQPHFMFRTAQGWTKKFSRGSP